MNGPDCVAQLSEQWTSIQMSQVQILLCSKIFQRLPYVFYTQIIIIIF